MLALLAALALSPNRVLPEPFLPGSLRPVLTVEALKPYAPVSVARGNYWRMGGMMRITYYYQFAKGSGPTHKQVMRQPGYSEELVAYGEQLASRAVRDSGGIRQTVRIMDLEDGTAWPWARVAGPATVAVVTETPHRDPPKWHRINQVTKPPVPPEFPPKFDCLQSLQVLEVRSDPIIPRYYRSTYSVQVRIASRLAAKDLVVGITRHLPPSLWITRESGDIAGIRLRKTAFGLTYIEVKSFDDPTGRYKSEANFSYLYDDSVNAPRILD